MKIEPPTLVKILDCMERDGLVSREPSPHDRRRNVLRPQPKVKPIWSEIVACARRVRARASEGLSDEELATLKRLLSRVRENLAGGARVNGAARGNPKSDVRSPKQLRNGK